MVFGTVSLKVVSPFFFLFQVCFVSEFFDGRWYLFGFEAVPLEWEEGVTGVICPH